MLPSLSSTAANPNDIGTMEVGAEADEDDALRQKFNYSKFSSLAERVLGEGDIDALKTLERFKARWTERYGFSSVGASSSSLRAITELHSSPVRTEDCGLIQSGPTRAGMNSELPRVSSRTSLTRDHVPLHESAQDSN
ncbi:hypothetical protein Salat_1721100 [Sesamum alatum]|uniref:Uncharacterized protein n=1 Tax=Sesamum alatum TaxID=300844 RepID=A0AAE1Y860_9LAMI|nr:hypothetical protein Salat_1721100 [Sesamum alatum]